MFATISFLLAGDTNTKKVSQEALNIISPIFIAIMAVLAICLIVVVLMQRPVDGNVSALSGGESETFYGKNKSATKEHKLKIMTIVFGSLLTVIALIYFILRLA